MSAILKCMSEIWGIPFSKNGGPKTTFIQLGNFKVDLTACILEPKTIYIIEQLRWKL